MSREGCVNIVSRRISRWGKSGPLRGPYTRPVRLEALLLWVGFGLYVSNLALGVAVQWRYVSTKRFHWVHHALYGVVFVAAGAAVLAGALAGSRWWPLAFTVGALAVLPRYRGGSVPHRNLAALGFVGYFLAIV